MEEATKVRDRAVRAELKKLREAAAAEDGDDPEAPPLNINDLREAATSIQEELQLKEEEAGSPPKSPRLMRTLSRTKSGLMSRGSAKWGGVRRSVRQPSFLMTHAESPGRLHAVYGPASPKGQAALSPLEAALAAVPDIDLATAPAAAVLATKHAD